MPKNLFHCNYLFLIGKYSEIEISTWNQISLLLEVQSVEQLTFHTIWRSIMTFSSLSWWNHIITLDLMWQKISKVNNLLFCFLQPYPAEKMAEITREDLERRVKRREPLRDMDLSGLNLDELSMEGGIFRKCKLTGSSFKRCRIKRKCTVLHKMLLVSERSYKV